MAADSNSKGSSTMDAVSFIFGVLGIYVSFMYYGLMIEQVTSFESPSGAKLGRTWFLQTVEAAANIVIGSLGLMVSGGIKLRTISFRKFLVCGAAQVSAKALTTQAMIFGVSFPVATLAKSAKMVPVMIGSIVLSGTVYSARKYFQVALIVGGTVLVNMAKKKSGGTSELPGLICLAVSLICDGLVGGLQTSMKDDYKSRTGNKLKPYEMMTCMNAAMCLVALVVATALSQLDGIAYVMENPEIMGPVAKFAFCSAMGQSFIFFTITKFDPLVTTTVTTTRKIFSVLLSIFVNGHQVNTTGWAGISVATLGILGEMSEKMGSKPKSKPTKA